MMFQIKDPFQNFPARKLGALIPFLFLCFSVIAHANEPESGSAIELIEEGYTHFDEGNPAEALRAFEHALSENPTALPALMGKAKVHAEQQEHDKAFAAFDHIVIQHPKNAFAWNGRGLAAFNLFDFDEALSSFKNATLDVPVNGFYYESLAWTHLCRGEYTEASKQAKTATLMYHQKGQSAAYPLLIAYFAHLADGKNAHALQTLRYAIQNKSSANIWPSPVFDYLARNIGSAELISFVADKSQETEAHTYIGLHLQSSGKPTEANAHFDWVSSRGDNGVFEYTLAKSLLTANRATALLN